MPNIECPLCRGTLFTLHNQGSSTIIECNSCGAEICHIMHAGYEAGIDSEENGRVFWYGAVALVQPGEVTRTLPARDQIAIADALAAEVRDERRD